ncbi:MAG: SDR family oxidoreductase [Bacillati bacterium ANGP1]|uniref:SDR family oxidoreductase n=1 Tax=Candidatus Segetimicrobium genomatis TaxID=2569760 RepID=A0A537JLR9_9BACT|nr:MAG: SDR family oxidoreductase [Terrabacteria group bacterium ANGP1]
MSRGSWRRCRRSSASPGKKGFPRTGRPICWRNGASTPSGRPRPWRRAARRGCEGGRDDAARRSSSGDHGIQHGHWGSDRLGVRAGGRPPRDQAIAVAGDVRDASTGEQLAAAARRKWNRLDVLVNNAGTSMIGPSESLPEDGWRLTIDTNLTGAFLCAQAAARVMIPQRRGVILNISSILGEVGLPKRAAYCASKHGLIGLTKVLAAEWARHGIRVVSIDPAYIKTPMDERDQGSGDYSNADIERRTPAGRFGTAEEVAKVATFLATDGRSCADGA